MRVLLTENAPVGMLHLASVDGIIVDFFPYGIYQDELYELKDFVKLCARTEYHEAIIVCNKSPLSDWIWSNPDHKELYELKGMIYNLAGWKPDVVINIYDSKPDPVWRKRLVALSSADPDLTIIGLNATDPKFSKNLIDTIKSLNMHSISNILKSGTNLETPQ